MRDFEYEPASDVKVPVNERPTSVLREPGLLCAATHRVTQRIVRLYLRFAHGLTSQGKEHLPENPPCIVVANHTSHLDALALIAALTKSWGCSVYPLAAGDVFFESPARASMAGLLINALPVDRKAGGRHAIHDLRHRLVRGRCVFILFPEGTRSATGELAAFKPGFGMLVADTNIPVIPCWIEGAFSCWPRQARLPRPGPIHVRFGRALRFSDLPNRRAGWEQATRDCEAAVRALSR
ncbi:MAG: lysophospholipid acyltransferase family protein [Planctomycetota bacterium]